MNNMINVKFNKATELIRTGDIIFYHPRRNKLSFGWILNKIKCLYEKSEYHHVGLLDYSNKVPWIIIDVDNKSDLLFDIIQKYDVDVFRVNKAMNTIIRYNKEIDKIEYKAFTFGDGDFITIKAIKLLENNPYYSYWNNIKAIFRRLFGYDKRTNDESILKVVNCASVIEYSYNENGFDLCPRISPNYATIDTISRSALLDYLFTITK